MNQVEKGPIKIKPSEIDTRRNELSAVHVGSPIEGPAVIPVAEPRFGPEIPIEIERDHTVYKPRTFADGSGIYDHPNASRPDRPNIVEGGIKPFDNTLYGMPRRTRRRMAMVYLEGGPFDGGDVEVAEDALVYSATVPTDPEKLQPFVFDAEAHRLT